MRFGFMEGFIMDMRFPGLDPARAIRSMELFATGLMPSFRDG
jgi:hypothetical protein